MTVRSFTAQELLLMAALSGKRNIYGIPDALAAVPEEQLRPALLSGVDALVQGQVAEMDFDGRVSLRPPYEELMSFCCDCDLCLTAGLQKEDGSKRSCVFWRRSGRYLMAEGIADRYSFSEVDEAYIRSTVCSVRFSGGCERPGPPATVPQIALTRARRDALSGRRDSCARLLRQNGASEAIAQAIVQGLEGTANYAAYVLMDNRSGECRQKERGWLEGGGCLLSLGRSVVNLRSCVVFSPVSKAEAEEQAAALLAEFISEESGVDP